MSFVFGVALGAIVGAIIAILAFKDVYDGIVRRFDNRVNEEVKRRLSGVDVKVNARVNVWEDDLGRG